MRICGNYQHKYCQVVSNDCAIFILSGKANSTSPAVERCKTCGKRFHIKNGQIQLFCICPRIFILPHQGYSVAVGSVTLSMTCELVHQTLLIVVSVHFVPQLLQR